MLGWNPSYDFRLFDVGWASPLQANEFGAATSFRASDPTAFVDFSLNQLRDLLNPRARDPFIQRQIPTPVEEIPFVSFFQGGAEDTRERLRKVRDEADRMLREAGGGTPQTFPRGGPDCPQGRNILGGCGPIVGSQPNQPGDASVGTATPTGKRIGEATAEWLKSLPAGSGVFLIAVAALIFILLFARK